MENINEIGMDISNCQIDVTDELLHIVSTIFPLNNPIELRLA